MPGYVLHLLEGEMVLNILKQSAAAPDEAWERAFRCGLLLPDAADDQTVKNQTHFRDPQKLGNVIVVPDLDRFLRQNPITLSDPIACGYYVHLHLDREYFSDYLLRYVTFFDADGKACFEKAKAVTARLTRTGKEIPRAAFFSKDYVYGDYSKLNRYLIDRFGMTSPRESDLPEGSCCGVAYKRLIPELEKLKGFIHDSEDYDNTLNVLDAQTLIQFLEACAAEAAQTLEQM